MMTPRRLRRLAARLGIDPWLLEYERKHASEEFMCVEFYGFNLHPL
jgi:hypothetical protein